MAEPPRRLEYARPQRPRRDDESPTWPGTVSALVAMGVGVVFLLVGIGNLAALFEGHGRSWQGNLFMGFVGTLAGFVFTIRPLYRMIRGRDWWTMR